METETMWIWAAIGLVAAVLYTWYVLLIVRRNKVHEALASVDVHLTQRHDLVPNIVELAAHVMGHERALIEEVTKLRTRVSAPIGAAPHAVQERFALEAELAQKTGRLLMTMEAYPELRSDTAVLEAQRTWTEVEAQVAAARRFYNAAVARLNLLVHAFPGRLLARIAGAGEMPFFEAPQEARTAPSARRILSRT